MTGSCFTIRKKWNPENMNPFLVNDNINTKLISAIGTFIHHGFACDLFTIGAKNDHGE